MEGSAPYHVRMQNYNEEENQIEIPKDVFADIINAVWARIFFFQLAYNQTPCDLVHKPSMDKNECLKKDSRFSTTFFHLDSKIQKHGIKENLPLAMVILHLRAFLESFILFLEAEEILRASINIYNPDVISKKEVYYPFKNFRYNAENGRMTKQHHLIIHHCEMMRLISKFQQKLEISPTTTRPK